MKNVLWKSQKSGMGLIGKALVMIYLQNIKNIDFKQLKTAIYIFSNMLNIKK